MPFDINKALASIASNRDLDAARRDIEEATRVGRNRLKQGSADQRIARAKAQEVSILDSIEMLKDLPDSDLKTTRMNNALERLGELYAEQGRYAEALSVTRDEPRRANYEQILAAITTPDDAKCECPDEVITDPKTQNRFRQPALQNVGDIVHEDRLVSLNICRKCGFAVTK